MPKDAHYHRQYRKRKRIQQEGGGIRLDALDNSDTDPLTTIRIALVTRMILDAGLARRIELGTNRQKKDLASLAGGSIDVYRDGLDRDKVQAVLDYYEIDLDAGFVHKLAWKQYRRQDDGCMAGRGFRPFRLVGKAENRLPTADGRDGEG